MMMHVKQVKFNHSKMSLPEVVEDVDSISMLSNAAHVDLHNVVKLRMNNNIPVCKKKETWSCQH